MQNKIKISSKLGDYTVKFFYNVGDLAATKIDFTYTIVDEKVWSLYKDFAPFKTISNPLFIKASEEEKTVETALRLIGELLDMGITRGASIVGIGGGITQDVVTFLSSVLFRGVPWTFIPTTLLAQCDSCIGGKSSLNYKTWKNQIGNFYPPREILICQEFTETLSNKDVRSGIGEMIKVHMVPGGDVYTSMEAFMKNIMNDRKVVLESTISALEVKKSVIEEDEFDTGLRLKMNLGHTFGHALEAASKYEIPHGIAVNIGILIASKFALSQGLINHSRNQQVLDYASLNIEKTDFSEIDKNSFFGSLKKDKKNKKGQYCFVVPTGDEGVELKYFPMTDGIDLLIDNCIEEVWSQS